MKNETAFPYQYTETVDGKDLFVVSPGLSKRGLFAGMVLQALITNSKNVVQAKDAPTITKDAITFADALIAGLELK